MTTHATKPDRRAALMTALQAMQSDEQKISISAVARKAGVTPALIHNTYPEVAEQIRKLTGREPAAIRSKEVETLLALQSTNKRLQQENIQLNADVARLASIMQTLNDEIARLRAVGTGKVVELVRQ